MDFCIFSILAAVSLMGIAISISYKVYCLQLQVSSVYYCNGIRFQDQEEIQRRRKIVVHKKGVVAIHRPPLFSIFYLLITLKIVCQNGFMQARLPNKDRAFV